MVWRCGLALLLLAPLTLSSAQPLPEQSFNLSATIVEGCLVNQQHPGNTAPVGVMGQLNFGTHPSLLATTVAGSWLPSSHITLECTPGMTITLRIDGGLYEENGQRHVQRQNNQDTLPYQLFMDSGLQQPWEINVASPLLIGSEPSIHLPIFGRLTILPGAHAGTYTDTLTVTLAW